MARLASSEFAADWVINSDADEFWWPERDNLKQVLADLAPATSAVSVERVNFLPRPLGARDFFADAMIVRDRRSLNPLGQPLLGKICHRAFADIEVLQGNHQIRRNGKFLSAEAAPITILHFPARSYRQFANKIVKGGAAYERNTELPVSTGSTWRQLYRTWQRGELEAYYRRLISDDETLARGLTEGRLVIDERLKIALSRLGRQD